MPWGGPAARALHPDARPTVPSLRTHSFLSHDGALRSVTEAPARQALSLWASLRSRSPDAASSSWWSVSQGTHDGESEPPRSHHPRPCLAEAGGSRDVGDHFPLQPLSLLFRVWGSSPRYQPIPHFTGKQTVIYILYICKKLSARCTAFRHEAGPQSWALLTG